MEVMAALSAVNTAIKVVKATVSTCQNLESLGPCLSQFFGAKEQAVAWAKKRKEDKIAAEKRRRRIQKIKCEAWKWGVAIVVISYLCLLVWSVVQIRIIEHPELGRCLIPKGTWPYKYYNNLKWVDCEIKSKEEN